jgi:hypothetical protein
MQAGAVDKPTYAAAVTNNVLSVSRAGSARRQGEAPLFSIDLSKLVYEDQYIRYAAFGVHHGYSSEAGECMCVCITKGRE